MWNTHIVNTAFTICFLIISPFIGLMARRLGRQNLGKKKNGHSPLRQLLYLWSCHYVWPSGGAITRGQAVVALRVAKRWCHYARPSSGSSMSSYPNMLGEGRFGVLKVTHWIFSITRAQPFYRHKLCGIRINNLFAVVCPFVCSSWVYDLFTAVVCIPLSAWCAVFILYAYISVS